MKKSELYKAMTEAILALKLSKEVTGKVLTVLDEYVKPKSGGGKTNLEEVIRRDKNGKITHILCQLSHKWLPATKEYFYEDKKGEGIGGTGLKRLSRQAEGIFKKYLKTKAASEKAIMQDVIAGKIGREKGQALLADLEKQKPDFSTIKENNAKTK